MSYILYMRIKPVTVSKNKFQTINVTKHQLQMAIYFNETQWNQPEADN